MSETAVSEPAGLRHWPAGDISVCYRDELDGAGSRLAPAFVDCVLQHSAKPVYEHAFEWCAGPGFIGFTLLARSVVRRLTLCDINPAAIDCVARTVAANGLAGQVRFAAGPDLDPLQPDEAFDLVVANPPNFYALNPRHPSVPRLAGDLRPNDPGWRVHRAFYAGIRRFLRADARMFISEVNGYDTEVFIPPSEPEPYDVRPRPAVHDFEQMIIDGGLVPVATVDYFTGRDGAELSMMISRPAGEAER